MPSSLAVRSDRSWKHPRAEGVFVIDPVDGSPLETGEPRIGCETGGQTRAGEDVQDDSSISAYTYVSKENSTISISSYVARVTVGCSV